MKLTTGVKWGLVAGLVVGVLAGVLAYMSVMSTLDALVEYAYQEMVKMGTPPAQARQAAELTRHIAPPSAFAGGIVANVIIYLIMGSSWRLCGRGLGCRGTPRARSSASC
jgi:thiamine transporter ThiT